ncbi:MAG: alpha/beta hydrolase [Pseudomonadota bacterium]
MQRPPHFHGQDTGQPPGLTNPSLLWIMPSLWIHGAGLSGSTWAGFTRTLRKAVTPDLPGHGTASTVHPPRVTRYASELASVMPEACVLVGHSLGGMVALELAARHPERVKALILIECVPTVRTGRLRLLAAQLAKGLMQSLPPSCLGWLSGLGQSAETARHLKEQLSQNDRSSISAALEAAIRYDGRRVLQQIKAPTLVIVGRKNRATHQGARLIAEEILDARLVVLPGGHMLHTDNPVQLRREIDRFLNDVLGGVSAGFDHRPEPQ